MKVVTAFAVLAALSVGAAHAQQAAVPPSACGAFTQTPSPPDGATATPEQMRAAVAGFEAWRVQTQATLDCRRAEVDSLNAQGAARTAEFRAAQTDNIARAAVFQAQLDIFTARAQR